MENKKAYHAPSAQIMLLAPEEEVTAFWGKGNGWWGNGDASWGNKPETASIMTGTLLINDEDGKSWKWP